MFCKYLFSALQIFEEHHEHRLLVWEDFAVTTDHSWLLLHVSSFWKGYVRQCGSTSQKMSAPGWKRREYHFAPSNHFGHLAWIIWFQQFNVLLLKLGERKVGGGRPRDAAQVHQHQAQFCWQLIGVSDLQKQNLVLTVVSDRLTVPQSDTCFWQEKPWPNDERKAAWRFKTCRWKV